MLKVRSSFCRLMLSGAVTCSRRRVLAPTSSSKVVCPAHSGAFCTAPAASTASCASTASIALCRLVSKESRSAALAKGPAPCKARMLNAGLGGVQPQVAQAQSSVERGLLDVYGSRAVAMALATCAEVW